MTRVLEHLMKVTGEEKTKEQLVDELAEMGQRAIQAENELAKATLFTRNKRLLDELTVLHSIAVAAAEASDEDILIERATQIIGEAIYSDNFGVFLLDEAKGVLHTHPSYRGINTTITLGEGIVGRVAATGHAWRVPDVALEPAYLDIAPQTRSELCVPLKIGERIIGVVNAESNQVNAFSEADERLLATFAQQLATAIEKAWLFEAERRRAAQQQILAESAGTILAALDQAALWPAVTTATQQILAADRAAVYLYDRRSDTLACFYAFGLAQEYTDELNRYFHQAPGGQVLQRSRPVVVNDVATDPASGKLSDLMAHEGFRSYAVFPLAASGGLPGAMVVYRNETVPFTSDDLAAGQTLTHIIAVALKNIQLFAETTLALTREQQLNEISRTLSEASDLPTILVNVVRMTTELVKADAGLLGLAIDNQIMTFYPHNLPPTISLRPLARGRSVDWQIWETGEPVLLARYDEHPDAQRAWIKAGVNAFIGVPIVAGEAHLGVLELFTFSPDIRFNERDLALVESVGRQAGVAIQNTRLYIEVQQRANALAAALTKQDELDNMKNLFIQNVSHELRTPLGIIFGYAELLESGELGELQPEQLQSVQIITRRARMLTHLVEDLTALLAAETQEFRREIIDPAELLYSMLADFQVKAKETGINLNAQVKQTLPFIKGDPTHLRRVFDNLVSNAFKFTPSGGSVTMRMWPDGRDVLLEVADTGVGMPTDQLERIFERFYQVESSPGRRVKGTGLGLGLALVKEIVEAHRGRVTVRSKLGEGTTFQIRLPAAEA